MIISNSENNLAATYAGTAILTSGQMLAATEYGFARNFTTTAESTIGAAAPTLRAYGNAQGIFALPIAEDFTDEATALLAALTRSDHAENNPTGTLTFTIGTTNKSWDAGIQSIETNISYIPGGVRLHTTYNFILAASISAT